MKMSEFYAELCTLSYSHSELLLLHYVPCILNIKFSGELSVPEHI